MQSEAIRVSKDIYPDKKWEKIMEPYISDLKVSCFNDLLDRSIIEKAYKSIILPLHEIALSNGFASDWVYKCTKNNLDK